MKKFLLTLLLALMMSISSYAQDRDYDVTPVVYYYSYAMIETDGVQGDWIPTPSVLTLYNRRATLKIRDEVFHLIQASEIISGTTDNGLEYDAVKLRDEDSKTILVLQMFVDKRMGIRLVHDAKNSIQFSN